jgi:23S rRNA pseudouridine2605 synthase
MNELEGIRLQKVLASAGLGSRRKCEEFISSGRVTVNDVLIDELGARVHPETDVIRVDGVRIAQAAGHVVVALNKPRGVVTSMSDEHNRECVGDLVAQYPERLFHVGRLDVDTEGLLLLTNDGELAQRLSHPTYGIEKTYFARVVGKVTKETMRAIKAGIVIEDRAVEVTSCLLVGTTNDNSVVELTIHEGRNRIIRRLFDEVGHPVVDLVRTQVGPVKLGALKSGHLREITNKELGKLYIAVGL